MIRSGESKFSNVRSAGGISWPSSSSTRDSTVTSPKLSINPEDINALESDKSPAPSPVWSRINSNRLVRKSSKVSLSLSNPVPTKRLPDQWSRLGSFPSVAGQDRLPGGRKLSATHRQRNMRHHFIHTTVNHFQRHIQNDRQPDIGNPMIFV